MDKIRQFFGAVCRLFVLIACIFSCPFLRGSQLDYFSDPKIYSKEELAEELKSKVLDMCWHFGKDSQFRFISGDNEIYFEIYLGTLVTV